MMSGTTEGAYLTRVGAIPLLTAQDEIALARRIKDGRQAARLLSEGTPDGELRERVRDGRLARGRMIEANLRLVVAVARRYAHRGLPMTDLVQAGAVGLTQAADRYDPSRGARFSTYAMWWINKAMRQAIATEARTVRLPEKVLGEMARAEQARRDLAGRLHREPQAAEVAAEAGMTPRRLADLARLSAAPLSLELLGAGVAVDIADDPGRRPEAVVEHAEVPRRVGDLLRGLADRPRQVLELRYGMVDGTVYTPAQVARSPSPPRWAEGRSSGSACRT